MSELSHHLAAVWFADIVGYTRLSEEDEGKAWRLVQAFQTSVRETAAAYDGRVVKFLGDGALAEFSSTEKAVRSADALHRAFARAGGSAGLGEPTLRVGVHVGDVGLTPDGDLFGDGVNVASRIQASADPGEVWVSEDVRRQLRQRTELRFEPRGEREMKGLRRPLAVHAVEVDEADAWEARRSQGGADRAPAPANASPKGRRKIGILAVAALLAVGLVAVGITRFLPRLADGGTTSEASIAVLPFQNMSSDADAQPFTDGLHDDILTQLVKIGDLRVISRTSVMEYRETSKNVREIADELGVGAVLEGGVQRSADRVRVNVQLIDAATDEHLWAETYDRELTAVHLFEIQREIATEIARALHTRLDQRERDRLAKVPTEDLAAYDDYLRGRDYFRRNLLREDVRSAVEAFESAVGRDPSFAEAWAMLSIARSTLSWEFNLNEERPAAESAARRALELDPELPLAHVALGYVHYYGHRRYDEALASFRRAQALSPNDPAVLAPIGWVLRRQGKFREAIDYFERAFAQDPRSFDLAWVSLGTTHTILRDYPSARRYLERAISIDPDVPGPWRSLVRLELLESGSVSDATAIIERAGERFALARLLFPDPPLTRILASRYGDRLLAETADPELVRGLSASIDVDLDRLNRLEGRAVILSQRGSLDRSRAALDSLRTLFGSLPPELLDSVNSYQGMLYTQRGRNEALLGNEGAAIADGLRGREVAGADAYLEPGRREELAEIYVTVGEREKALEELEWLLTNPSYVSPALVRLDPLWEPLRGDPRFQRLVQGEP